VRLILDQQSIYNFLKRVDVENGFNSFRSFPIERNGYEEGSIRVYPGGYIRFFGRLEYLSPGGYIHLSGSEFSLFSDFAEKDISSQTISGNKHGRHVSSNEFFELLRINMPHHFEWCLWNFI
jgi:hypothetical protein